MYYAVYWDKIIIVAKIGNLAHVRMLYVHYYESYKYLLH